MRALLVKITQFECDQHALEVDKDLPNYWNDKPNTLYNNCFNVQIGSLVQNIEVCTILVAA